MTGIISSGDVTTLIGQYSDVFAVIASSMLLLGALFIVKGGYKWVLGMIQSALNFGGR